MCKCDAISECWKFFSGVQASLIHYLRCDLSKHLRFFFADVMNESSQLETLFSHELGNYTHTRTYGITST